MLLPYASALVLVLFLVKCWTPSDVFLQCPRGLPSRSGGPGRLFPGEATPARAVTPTSLPCIAFWSVAVRVPEVLVRLVSCCEGCCVFFLLFLVPLCGGFGGGGAAPASTRRAHPWGPPRAAAGICVSCGESCTVTPAASAGTALRPGRGRAAGRGGSSCPRPRPARARPPPCPPGLLAAAPGEVSWRALPPARPGEAAGGSGSGPPRRRACPGPGLRGLGRGGRRYLLLSYCPGRRAGGRYLLLYIVSGRRRRCFVRDNKPLSNSRRLALPWGAVRRGARGRCCARGGGAGSGARPL